MSPLTVAQPRRNFTAFPIESTMNLVLNKLLKYDIATLTLEYVCVKDILLYGMCNSRPDQRHVVYLG